MDIPKEFLSKEFLSQFKTGEDVTAFMKELHTRVYEQMLEAEMDNHLGYEKHSNQGDHSGNSRNGSYRKQIQTGLSPIKFSRSNYFSNSFPINSFILSTPMKPTWK